MAEVQSFVYFFILIVLIGISIFLIYKYLLNKVDEEKNEVKK